MSTAVEKAEAEGARVGVMVEEQTDFMTVILEVRPRRKQTGLLHAPQQGTFACWARC
jgi:hypothetical protein